MENAIKLSLIVGQLVLCLFGNLATLQAQQRKATTVAFTNGSWFNGKTFEQKTFYSVNGVFTAKKPSRLDSTINLSGMYCVPPFAEGHNHNIDGAVEERGRKAIERYLADGVFYVKIQGNFPLTDEMKQRLRLNQPQGCFITSTAGHPIFLQENVLFAQGYYPGLSKDTLQNNLYFTIDSEADLEQKWPAILRLKPEFIKTTLWCSDEYEKRKTDPAYVGRKGLDPAMLKKIVAKAHASKLRVSVHITNAADFHNAVLAGVDEIAHSIGPGYFKNIEERGSDPRFLSNTELMVKSLSEALHTSDPASPSVVSISAEVAKSAAKQGITGLTRLGGVTRSAEPVRSVVKPVSSAEV